jgi:hypothetical protein
MGNSDSVKDLEIKLHGKGSGVVMKGEGSGGFATSESAKVAKEIREKLDPTLAAQCEKLANAITQRSASKTKPKIKDNKSLKNEHKIDEVRVIPANATMEIIPGFTIHVKATVNDSVLFDSIVIGEDVMLGVKDKPINLIINNSSYKLSVEQIENHQVYFRITNIK